MRGWGAEGSLVSRFHLINRRVNKLFRSVLVGLLLLGGREQKLKINRKNRKTTPKESLPLPITAKGKQRVREGEREGKGLKKKHCLCAICVYFVQHGGYYPGRELAESFAVSVSS